MLQSRGGTFHSAAPFSCPVASLPLHSAVSKNFRLPHLEIAKKCLGIWEEVFPRQCIAGGSGWVSWKGFWKISAGPVRKSSKYVSVSEGRFFKKYVIAVSICSAFLVVYKEATPGPEIAGAHFLNNLHQVTPLFCPLFWWYMRGQHRSRKWPERISYIVSVKFGTFCPKAETGQRATL